MDLLIIITTTTTTNNIYNIINYYSINLLVYIFFLLLLLIKKLLLLIIIIIIIIIIINLLVGFSAVVSHGYFNKARWPLSLLKYHQTLAKPEIDQHKVKAYQCIIMLKKDTDLNEFNLDNLKLCFYFALSVITFTSKKKKKAKPWTVDKILQELRFCNLHREHDNVSRTIISFLRLSKHNIKLVFNAINCRRLNHNYTIVSAANALVQSHIRQQSLLQQLKRVTTSNCTTKEKLHTLIVLM